MHWQNLRTGLLYALALVGIYALVMGGWQLRTDYHNFRRIVIWVAQKQAQEQQMLERQRQQQQAQQGARPTAGQAVPEAEARPAKP